MRYLITPLLILLLLSQAILAGNSKQDEKLKYFAKKIENLPPTIDGKLNEGFWTTNQASEGFTQFQPYEGREPSCQTRFAIFYDDNNLYVGIWALDPNPDSISRRLTRRDDIDGDVVGVDIDSYYDQRTAFGFWVSASGVKLDRVATGDGDTEDDTWDPVWFVETEINAEGWTAEMKIPFSQLRFGKMENQIWGLNVVRSIFRHEEVSVWAPLSREASGYIHLYGTLEGMDGIQPKKQLDLTPYVVASVETFEQDPEDPFKSAGNDYHYTAGLDAKVGLTNNMILDLSVNPDFGQVEADPSEVNLSAFETFFEEKRPFFIEGRTILSLPLMLGDGDLANENLFYTRRIGRRPQGYPSLGSSEYGSVPDFTRILGAAKVTGKTKDGWSIGLLESVTMEEKAEIKIGDDTRYETVEPLTNYTIGTVHKDFNQGNTLISGMLTSTNRKLDGTGMDWLHSNAFTAGFDYTQFFKDKSYMLMVKTYFSQVNGSTDAISLTQQSSARYFQRPDIDYVHLDTTRTGLFGNGGTAFFGRIGNAKFQYGAFLTWKTPGIELNDVGYIRMADQILEILWAGYRINEPFSIFRQININTNHWTGHDFGGRFMGYGGNINGMILFKNMWATAFGLNWDLENLDSHILRGGPAFKSPNTLSPNFHLETDGRKKVKAEANVSFMRSENGHFNMDRYNLEFSYRPLNALVLSLTPYYSRIDNNLQYMGYQEYQGDPRYLFGHIDQHVLGMSMRINLTLTPNLTIQYWGQPFIATGVYDQVKMITDPLADQYTDRYHTFTDDEIVCYSEDAYCAIDENRDGTADYYLDFPDFNVKEFKSNLVIRWEYRPSSTIYLVWSQGRSGYDPYGDFAFGRDLGDLFDLKPNNIFLIKLSYRFGL